MMKDKIAQIKEGCGKGIYCSICEKFNCDCSSSECFKGKCGEVIDNKLFLCSGCQAELKGILTARDEFVKMIDEIGEVKVNQNDGTDVMIPFKLYWRKLEELKEKIK